MTMPGFLARLTRPFTTGSALGIASETGAGSSAASAQIPEGAQKATVAAGCFWGVEHIYRQNFKGKLYDARVGYIGGDVDNPSYRDVCTGETNRESSSDRIYLPALTHFFVPLLRALWRFTPD